MSTSPKGQAGFNDDEISINLAPVFKALTKGFEDRGKVDTYFLIIEISINLAPVFKALRKGIPWIIIAAVVFGSLAYFGTKMFITPTYMTLFRVYVNNSQDSSDKTSITNSDLSASRSLASTYAEIIKGRTVLTTAAEKTGITAGYNTLNSMVSVDFGSATEIISVGVTTVSPEMSLQYANNIIEVAEEQVSSIVDGSSMRVIDEPFLPTGSSYPNYRRNTILGALAGAALVILFIVLRELLDNRVRDEESLEERYGVAILGSIPNQEAASKAGSHYGKYGYGYGYADAGKEAQKK